MVAMSMLLTLVVAPLKLLYSIHPIRSLQKVIQLVMGRRRVSQPVMDLRLDIRLVTTLHTTPATVKAHQSTLAAEAHHYITQHPRMDRLLKVI